MTRAALDAGLRELEGAVDRLRVRVREAIPDGDVDRDQVAASELAWATARLEAARATAEWTEATGDELAALIAQDASVAVVIVLANSRGGSGALVL